MIGIKGMSMPECCAMCSFYSGAFGGVCLAEAETNSFLFSRHTINYGYDEKQDWCPLVDIELTTTIKN